MTTLNLTGLKGDNGNTFRLGQGFPASILGSDNDVYLDLTTGKLYARANGAWTFKYNLSVSINGKTGSTITLAAADVGAISGDASDLVALGSLPIRTAQVTRAIKPLLVAAGTSFSAFLAAMGSSDATDGTWEAVYIEAYAPVGGVLYTSILAFLQTRGMTIAAVTNLLTTAWANAPFIVP